jgi:protein-S-isoprenylcysteine O-methyltransferase Ste14
MRSRVAARLLWLDALGGLAAGTAVLLLHDRLPDWYGLPAALVVGLGLANVTYGVSAGALALTPRWRRPLPLAALSLANIAWGGVCWWLFASYAPTARWLGLAALAAEGVYVPLLGLVEWGLRHDVAQTADSRGPQWHWLECRVPPPVVALVAAASMHTLARTWPGERPAVWRGVSVGLAVSGLLLACWAIASFRRAATTIHPTTPHAASSLVIAGPNRWSRNPMYVGLLLVLLAWGLWLGSAVALLLLPAVWGWLLRFQVMPEERALAARFGTAYAAYALRVRRWI